MFIGKPGGGLNPNAYALQDTTYVSATEGPEIQQPDLLVAHLQAGAAGAGIAELWVNPTPGMPLGTPDASRDNLTLVAGGETYVNLHSSGFYTTDELRIGPTAADVLPVPAPVGGVLPAFAALLALRRRRGWSRFRSHWLTESAPALCFHEHLHPFAFRRKRNLL